MKLIDWRTQVAEIQVRAELARRWFMPAETLRRWEMGERIPGPDDMKMIFRNTRGLVGPSDFYDIPDHTAVTGSTPNGEAA